MQILKKHVTHYAVKIWSITIREEDIYRQFTTVIEKITEVVTTYWLKYLTFSWHCSNYLFYRFCKRWENDSNWWTWRIRKDETTFPELAQMETVINFTCDTVCFVIKIKANLSLYTPWRHIVRMELRLHSFFTSTLHYMMAVVSLTARPL